MSQLSPLHASAAATPCTASLSDATPALAAQVRSCWTDIARAIEGARDFVYITGWSMHPNTRLTRHGGDEGVEIGALLKRKAAEKVCVCLLVRRPAVTPARTLPPGTPAHEVLEPACGYHLCPPLMCPACASAAPQDRERCARARRSGTTNRASICRAPSRHSCGRTAA